MWCCKPPARVSKYNRQTFGYFSMQGRQCWREGGGDNPASISIAVQGQHIPSTDVMQFLGHTKREGTGLRRIHWAANNGFPTSTV